MGIVKIVFVAALDMSLRIARYSFVRQEFGLHYESVRMRDKFVALIVNLNSKNAVIKTGILFNFCFWISILRHPV